MLALDPVPRAARVFAVQFRQVAANVRTYATFRAAVECALRRYVLPYLARGRPNVVVFDEDVGLMTIATGSRGARARAQITSTSGTPGCQGQAPPCATLAALAALDAGYAGPEAYYARRFGRLPPLGASFVAATDVFVRGFMQTFSQAARRHGIYLIASNTQAPFHLSHRRADVRALADPDLLQPRSVFVADGPRAYDQTFIWAPRDVRHSGPGATRNLVATNRKVPLTAFEAALGFAPGPSGGPAAVANLRPYRLPGTRARLGLATSLPAFTYGAPRPGHACDDVSVTYMSCLSSLGANVVIQADANDGAWTGPDADPSEQWQPLSWMASAYRAVTDPAVRFVYAVNPFLVGNLADTPFDGQSAILQRGLRGRGCNYVGNGRWLAGEDRPALMADAGPKPQFLALAPWVARDGPRAALRTVGQSLLTGSGSPRENGYLQTALVADLPFPPDPHRAPCATG